MQRLGITLYKTKPPLPKLTEMILIALLFLKHQFTLISAIMMVQHYLFKVHRILVKDDQLIFYTLVLTPMAELYSDLAVGGYSKGVPLSTRKYY
jgi:hypothetical protein